MVYHLQSRNFAVCCKKTVSGKGGRAISNEEMAKAIQQGEDGYIPVLWNCVYRFIDTLACKFLEDYPKHYWQLREDMVNESYFAFLRAIEDFDQERGRFTTFLSWKLRNTFKEVIQGGTRGRDLLSDAVSLDTPLNGTDDLTIAETLPELHSDPHSDPHRGILKAEYSRGVSTFLDEALKHVTDEAGKRLIKFMYVHNCGLTEATRRLYGEDVPVPVYQYNKALAQIRRFATKDSIRNKLEFWGVDDFISCAGTSISSFKKRGFTSSVEVAVMKRESFINHIQY